MFSAGEEVTALSAGKECGERVVFAACSPQKKRNRFIHILYVGYAFGEFSDLTGINSFIFFEICTKFTM